MSFKNLQNRHTFNMPDGSILHKCVDVDRYYNLGRGVTVSRLRIGWTLEECANNRRKNKRNTKRKYTFNMPDGSVLYSCADVDRYYNLGRCATVFRLRRGWTLEECANNKRKNAKYTFNMPDGSILHSCVDVDRYYNLGKNVTVNRLHTGWTVEECANNRRNNVKYTFNMPDGSVLYKCTHVDRYYNKSKGTTLHRLLYGWTEQECANNRRFKK